MLNPTIVMLAVLPTEAVAKIWVWFSCTSISLCGKLTSIIFLWENSHCTFICYVGIISSSEGRFHGSE